MSFKEILNSFLIKKFRIFDHMWIASYPLSLLESPSYIVREKWNRKKNMLRMIFALIATFLIFIGAELSSPNYSFSTHLYEAISSKGSLINELSENQSFHFKGSTLKLLIFFILSYFIYSIFLFNDPLSNTELLRSITIPGNSAIKGNKKISFIHKLMDEVIFYAKYCPSNLLTNRCAECANNGCANRLIISDHKKTSRWNTIFANLENRTICDLLYHTHRCRLMFYFQYSIWFSVFCLVPIYILVRSFERILGMEVYFNNKELLIYIIVLCFIGLIVRGFNSLNKIGSRGVWGHFKEYVERLLEDQSFKDIFDQYVCKHNKMDFSYEEKFHLRSHSKVSQHEKISGSELQALLTSMKYIDKIIKLKLSKILSDDNYIHNDKDHLRNTISAIIEMLVTLNQSKHRFRGVLLVKDYRERCLTPLVTVPFPGQPFLSYRDPEYFCEKLSEDSDAIAVQSWQKKSIISASNEEIPLFHDEQNTYLRSIISLPLIVDKDIQDLFLKNGISLEDIIGVVCLDCDDDIVFSKENQYLNDLILTPFINRLLFQMLFAVKQQNRSELNE